MSALWTPETGMTDALASLLVEAADVGVAGHTDLAALGASAKPDGGSNTGGGLEDAWKDFLATNPDFDDGSFLDEDPAGEQQGDIDFALMVTRAVQKLRADRDAWSQARITNHYERYYEADEEGTGLHDDNEQNCDLVAMHTRFGSADFTATTLAGEPFSQEASAGSVIVIRVGVMHAASGPIDGPREMEGYGITL